MSTNLQRGEFQVLGEDHPLTRATSRLSVAVEQCFTVSVLLAVGVYGLIDGLSIGLPLAVAAATVLIVLLGRVGALIQSRNHRAVDLIAEGRGSLAVEAVMRERRRLLDPSDRERMARTLDVIRTEVAVPGAALHRVQPLYNISVVRGVASELGELAILVREGGGLRGLARAEQLVTDGRSPLYGASEVVLHQELGRICFLLRSADGEGSLGMGITPHSESATAPVACWTGPPRAEVTVVRSLRSFLRREPPQETECPRCGVPAPPGDVVCTACGWDLHDAYHDPIVEADKDTVAGDRGT